MGFSLQFFVDEQHKETYEIIPVVPRKAVAEGSSIDNYGRGELIGCIDGKANPLMHEKVIADALFGVAAAVKLATTAEFSVV